MSRYAGIDLTRDVTQQCQNRNKRAIRHRESSNQGFTKVAEQYRVDDRDVDSEISLLPKQIKLRKPFMPQHPPIEYVVSAVVQAEHQNLHHGEESDSSASTWFIVAETEFEFWLASIGEVIEAVKEAAL